MSTTPAPALPNQPWWRGWADFWFRPTDPTTLAFIRICTGLLVLYTHLTYSRDLQAFFGKHGWYAAAFVDRERHEQPIYISPTDWDEPGASPRLSDFPHRRAAFMEFLRNVPGNPADRAAALAYLKRANELSNPDDFRVAMEFVRDLPTGDEVNKTVTVIENGEGKDRPVAVAADRVPGFFLTRDAAERKKIADEVRAFWAVLPKTQTADASRTTATYVVNHFIELPPAYRAALVRYIFDLPEDPAEREKWLDYLNYWNADRRLTYRTGTTAFSVWFHVTDPTQMALVHAGIIATIVLFTVGLFTRVTSVLVWVACVGYIHRTTQVLFGMDTMMNILLFYLMIGNSGAALSLDRLIARYRAARASLKRTGTIDANTRAFLACPPPSVGAGFALRLLQVHVCFIYMAAGLSKLKGVSWWSGAAFWEVAVNPEFTPLNFAWYETVIRWMAEHKWVYHTVCTVGVWFTLAVEISLPFLVWTKARWLILLLATAMHAAIGVMMGLNLFELLMIVMFIGFMPDRVIRDRFRGGPNLPRFTFAFNPAADAHARAAALALALDADNQIALKQDRAAAGTSVAGADGVARTGPDGRKVLSKGLRFLSAVSWALLVPGVSGLLTRRLFPTAPTAAPAPVAVPKVAPTGAK
ncbi:Thiol-disulfide oxidoreductase DCC OS=Isosphaera pallida (strain ATCC 43644 / DSM 9630 / IS1B) GN=Isop_3458 PE=4 SV=1 [Gemmataceae bacterium]|nr:Thiol-disulfide oxidoreductase DCC OS=Isosphaera pallida (strain ATCC 43644 / DSM 9630 / IS1B) GN=Isop_3458 PE=4 SV=1 [Gemmataceae bacterium]VTU01055.1 Thiol-disulfide oxidoreductase DCC OS=Isosphaera pallida (strain ATCC 43644 / DSM 9630 / IS1B) GN=Isop_3458 PE=4 SV=1 [Gemmataceae bacterium]